MWRGLRFRATGEVELTAAGAAQATVVGGVAAFLGAVGAHGGGVGLFPDVGPQRVIVGRAGQHLVQRILQIGGYQVLLAKTA